LRDPVNFSETFKRETISQLPIYEKSRNRGKEGFQMKVAKYITYVTIAIIFMLWAVPVMSQQPSNDKLKAFYEASIDERISKCESKTAMLNSKFGNVRSAAENALLKAEFLNNYKEILVQDMISSNVGIKPYKIDYYLNQRFFATIRSKEALVVTDYSKSK